MMLSDRFWLVGRYFLSLSKTTYNNVVQPDETSNNKTLAHFNPIYTCIDVDSVCTEDSQHAHVHIVKYAEVTEVA